MAGDEAGSVRGAPPGSVTGRVAGQGPGRVAGPERGRTGVPPDVSAAVAQYLAWHADVDAAWLFGSQAGGRARPDSDVDVALLFRRGIPAERSAAARGTMMDELGARIGRPADVVDVERLSPRVFASVMRDSRLLLDRDPRHRMDALVRQCALWHDMQPHYRLQREATRAFFS